LQAIWSLSKHLRDSQPFIANPTQKPMARDVKSEASGPDCRKATYGSKGGPYQILQRGIICRSGEIPDARNVAPKKLFWVIAWQNARWFGDLMDSTSDCS